MHEIAMQEPSQDFLSCWQAAATHLNSQVQGSIQSWLRAHPYPPFLEHLSFRIENQLFFIRVEDVDGKIESPGSLRGLYLTAEGNNGHACLMPMKKAFKKAWMPAESGWGLIDPVTKTLINPFALVTDEKIEMSSWELHDMAVQTVRGYLNEKGYQRISWQSNPDVDPAIWFVGESQGPEWVVVRATRYPEKTAPRPENWSSIVHRCSKISEIGHFASVAIVSAEQDFDSGRNQAKPLWRGYGMYVRFTGLE